jgi:hypothetical protein
MKTLHKIIQSIVPKWSKDCTNWQDCEFITRIGPNAIYFNRADKRYFMAGEMKISDLLHREKRKAKRLELTPESREALLRLLLSLSRQDRIFFYGQLQGRL